MAVDYDDTEVESDLESDEEGRPKKQIGSLITLLVVVVVVIFIILMLRSCGERASGEASKTGGKSIEAVEGYVPVEGAVSVWITDKLSIDDVLSAADVRVGDYVDMGGGKYILDVDPGTEDSVIYSLKKTTGCYDAGKVYEAPK